MLKNGLYSIGGMLVRLALGVATVPLLIRLIGIENYGLWSLISASVGMFALAEAGFSTSTTVFLARDLAASDENGLFETLTVILGFMLIAATFTAFVLYFGAPYIVHLFPKLNSIQRNAAIQTLQISSIVVVAQLLQRVMIGIQEAYQSYGVLSILNTLQAILSNGGLLLVAWLGGKTVEMMQWYAVVYLMILLGHIIVAWSLIRRQHLRLIWNHKKGLAIVHYSLITWFGSLGGLLFGQGDRLIVGSVLGATTLGIYAAITTITIQINSLSAVIVQPLLPVLSSLMMKHAIHDEVMTQKVKQAFQMNGLLALSLGVALFTFAEPVMRLLFPSVINAEQIVTFKVAVIIYALYSLNAVGYYILFSINKVKVSTIIILTSGIFSLLLIFIGANTWNLLGAVIGNSGYIATLSLVVVGVRSLDIKFQTLIKWIGFLLIWFVLSIICNISIADRFNLLGIAFLIQGCILFIWFVCSQRTQLRWMNRFVATRT